MNYSQNIKQQIFSKSGVASVYGRLLIRISLYLDIIVSIFSRIWTKSPNTRIYNLNSGPHITHFLAVVAKKQENFE